MTSGYRSLGLPGQCPKCGEDGRMVETTVWGPRQAMRTTHYCGVCATSWPATPLPVPITSSSVITVFPSQKRTQ